MLTESVEIFFQDAVQSIFLDKNWYRLSDLLRSCDCALFLHGAFYGQQLGFKLCRAGKKKFWFLIFFQNCFQEEVQYRDFTTKLWTYFAPPQIIGKFIRVWGLLHQYGTTGAQRTGTFLLNLGLRKMSSKLLTPSVLQIWILLAMLHRWLDYL